MGGELEESLGLEHRGGSWAGYSDPRYEGLTGMFGGWTAALLLRAILNDNRASGDPAALSVNFSARLPAGRDLNITSEPIAGGRRVQHWSVHLTDNSGASLAHASVILSERPESGEFIEPMMPTAPEPTTLQISRPPGAVGAFVETRPVFGLPPFGRRETRSVHWVRETSGRTMDAVQIVFLWDITAPRSMYLAQLPAANATLTMSVYFLATLDEICAIGDDFILNETIGTRAAGSLAGQRSYLWTRHRVLLATTEQLSWFR
jgi:acyl-CoA thioesterase